MRYMRFVPILLLVLAGCTGNTRQVQIRPEERLAGAQEAYNEQVEDDDEQVVCRHEAVTGSRIKKSVCRSKRQIAEEERTARRYLEKARPYPTQGQ
jgi:hypothetical protein